MRAHPPTLTSADIEVFVLTREALDMAAAPFPQSRAVLAHAVRRIRLQRALLLYFCDMNGTKPRSFIRQRDAGVNFSVSFVAPSLTTDQKIDALHSALIENIEGTKKVSNDALPTNLHEMLKMGNITSFTAEDSPAQGAEAGPASSSNWFEALTTPTRGRPTTSATQGGLANGIQEVSSPPMLKALESAPSLDVATALEARLDSAVKAINARVDGLALQTQQQGEVLVRIEALLRKAEKSASSASSPSPSKAQVTPTASSGGFVRAFLSPKVSRGSPTPTSAQV